MHRLRRRPASGGGKGLLVLKQSTWTPASRREIIILLAYFGLVVAVTDVVNVRAGVELMTLAVVVAATFITRRPRAFWRDWWFYLAGIIMWNLSGPIAAHSPFPVHVQFMIDVDRAIGFGQQPVAIVQHHLMHPGTIGPLDWITAAAYNMHVPEPYIAGYLLWRLSRLAYLRFAAAALVLLVVGFVSFIVFPAVPPWLSSRWYNIPSTVVNGFGPVLQAHPLPFHGTPIFYVFKLSGDAVAAFPSEHAAFPMLEFLAFWPVVGRRVRTLLAVWVLAVLFTILYLGEHWVTDALAGYLYALVIWGAVLLVTRRASRQVTPVRDRAARPALPAR